MDKSLSGQNRITELFDVMPWRRRREQALDNQKSKAAPEAGEGAATAAFSSNTNLGIAKPSSLTQATPTEITTETTDRRTEPTDAAVVRGRSRSPQEPDGSPTISTTGTSSVTLDETVGLQNATATPTEPGDNSDNDILIDELSDLPDDFATSLTALGLGVPTIGAALSGYTGADGNVGSNAFTISGFSTGSDPEIAFVDGDGTQLSTTTGIDSGLKTISGNSIFLYADGTNNNVVIGRAGTGSTENNEGTVIFAAYIEETRSGGAGTPISGGKIWTVQYAPLQGIDDQNSDEQLNLADILYVGASQPLKFDLTSAPSGQNLFLMFTTANPNISAEGRIEGVSIIATGKNPANESEGVNINTGDTINSSQAGGLNTFGTNNQMIVEGEGIRLTFVTGANRNFTVPELSETQADAEENIDFTDVFNSRSAQFDVVQLQDGKSAVVKISAYSTDAEKTTAFIDGYAGDAPVGIESAQITFTIGKNNDAEIFSYIITKGADGTAEYLQTAGTSQDPGDFGLSAEFSPEIGTDLETIDTLILTGVVVSSAIRYNTTAGHNRVLVENVGDGSNGSSADFDIGNFALLGSNFVATEIGSKIIFEDDGPSGTITLSGLTLNTDESVGPNSLQNGDTETAPLDSNYGQTLGRSSRTYSELVTDGILFGSDGAKNLNPKIFALIVTDGTASGYTTPDDSATILLYNNSGVIEGRVGTASGNLAFTVEINTSSGEVTLSQYLAVRHSPNTNDDELSLGMPTDALQLKVTSTDKDDDSIDRFVDLGSVIRFEDDGPSGTITLSGLTLNTDESVGPNSLQNGDTETAPLDSNYGQTLGRSSRTYSELVTDGILFGSDGAKNLNPKIFALIVTDGTASGYTTPDDSATILLYNNSGVIEGRVGTAFGNLAFTVEINTSSGEVTLSQYLAVRHSPNTNDDQLSLGMPTDALQLKVTSTDKDDDSIDRFVDLGSVIRFEDDGPSGTITLSGLTLNTDESVGPNSLQNGDTETAPLDSNYGQTLGRSSRTYSELVTDGILFGSDGAKNLNPKIFALIVTDGTASGYTTPDDSATILLYNNSGVIEGRVGTASGNLAFTVEINTSSGEVTLSQYLAVRHSPNTNDDQLSLGMPTDALQLKVTSTDKDDDSIDRFVDLGSVIRFEDDGPSGTITLSGLTLNTDESVGPNSLQNGDTETAPLDSNYGQTLGRSARTYSELVTDGILFGSDGAKNLNPKIFALIVTDGTASGYTTPDDSATILLYNNSGVIEGRVGTASGNLAFTVEINTSSGEVTLSQYLAVRHSPNTNDDQLSLGMPTDALQLKVTSTDKDDDSIDRFVDLGSVIRFEDDGPSGTITLSGLTLNTDESVGPNSLQNGDTETAPLDSNYGQTLGRSSRTYSELVTDGILFGSDGAKNLNPKIFALIVTDGTASGYTTPDDSATILLYNNSGVIEGRVGTASGNLAFTVEINTSSGEVTLSQYLAVRHSPNTNDDQLSLGMPTDALQLKVTSTDKDDDSIDRFVDLGSVIRFEDDGPSISKAATPDSTPDITNDTWTYSGDFAYSIGSDKRATYLSTSSDFVNISLAGKANDVNISSPTVTWASENDSETRFDVSFGYDNDRDLETPNQVVTGLLTFDKTQGTYSLQIDALETQQAFTLGEGTGYEGYPLNSMTPSNGPQPVATGQLGEDFFIQITGFNKPLQAGAGGDKTFSTGELISGSTDSVTLSSTALGVSGNTIQAGEAAKIQFFTGNPFGYLNKTDYQYVSDFYLKFDGYETESDDLIIVLELVKSGDTSIRTTRAMHVDQGDAFENDDYANLRGTQYEGLVTNIALDGSPSFLDNNDALVIIESNDYNIAAGDNWLIKTVQILSSPDDITGEAINLNRNVVGGATSMQSASSYAPVDSITGLIGPGNTIGEDTSTNPLKIIDAGFTSAETTPPSLDLELTFAIVDADGDSTATQKIDFEYGIPTPPPSPTPMDMAPDPNPITGTPDPLTSPLLI